MTPNCVILRQHNFLKKNILFKILIKEVQLSWIQIKAISDRLQVAQAARPED